MKNRFILVTAVVITALAACSKEQADSTCSLSLRVGFEQETKTYVRNSNTGEIGWGNTNQDRVIYVFDESEDKYSFTSTSTTAEAARVFTCDSWGGGDWKMAVWTGMVQANDQCSLSGSVLAGSSLKVMNPQMINNARSFDSRANIAVMKAGDHALKSVFGFLRFTLPYYPASDNPSGTTLSAIKHVTFSADEYVAGKISIDYSGTDPVVTIVSEGSRSLTLDARWKNSGSIGYEGGTVYMVLPPGTYHNAILTITPFAEEPTSQNAATGAPFFFPFVGDVVIQRNQYVDCGILPAQDIPFEMRPDGEGYDWSATLPSDL